MSTYDVKVLGKFRPEEHITGDQKAGEAWRASWCYPQLAEVDMRSRRVGRAAVPHSAGVSGCHFNESGVGILDAYMKEGLLLAPGATGWSDFITQGCPAAVGEFRRDVSLGRAVVIHIDVRTAGRSSEESLGLRVVQCRFRLGRHPGVTAVAADAGIGPWWIGGETCVIVIGRAHNDL